MRVVGASNLATRTKSKVRNAKSEELLRRAQSGEREAFDELVRRTHGDAYGLALKLTNNSEDARDVVQDAYLRAYKSLKSFRGEASFNTWLYRIVANCAYTHTKKKRKHRYSQLPDESLLVETRTDNDPGEFGEFIALRDELADAVQALPKRLRTVIVLRDIYDLPNEAIAQELGISVGAAKVRLHRARQRLREQLFSADTEQAPAQVTEKRNVI